MHLTFKKGFDGDLEKLPKREVPGSHQFQEFGSMEKMSLVANILAFGIIIPLMIPVVLRFFRSFGSWVPSFGRMILLFVLLILSIPVHECLLASMFQGEVEFYTYFRKGLAFVIGPESMTKGRFILMSLLPNLVLGLVPYLLYFVFPDQVWLGILGASNIASGAGDYINVYNALTQMPKGSLTYMSGMHSYWYLPEEAGEEAETTKE